MKRTFRLLSLLLSLLLCCSVFFACANDDGKEQKTEGGEDVTDTPESKEPKGSYKLRFTSNGDGTCSITGIEISEDAANLTLVIPETSPDGEKVTAYKTNALAFTNIPFLILEEDYIAHIKTPMKQAVERGELSEFVYELYVEGYFFENSLENEETDLAKKAKLLNYPITAVADVYEFFSDTTDMQKATFSLLLSKHANYTSAEYFADVQKMIDLARQNEIYSYSADDLPVKASAFTSISLPSSLESVYPFAFFGCDAVKGNLHENAIYFGNEENPYLMLHKAADANLTSLVMPKSTKFIGDCAFEDCTKLESVSIAQGVKYLGKSVFAGCTGLKSIVIPEGVNTINYSAFASCESLAEVVLPKSVEKIGSSAFYGCRALKTVYYAGTAEEWMRLAASVDPKSNEYLINATRYYYSETQPAASGNYWRYVDGVPTAW